MIFDNSAKFLLIFQSLVTFETLATALSPPSPLTIQHHYVCSSDNYSVKKISVDKSLNLVLLILLFLEFFFLLDKKFW